jgi:hypothetical protein
MTLLMKKDILTEEEAKFYIVETVNSPIFNIRSWLSTQFIK